MPTFITVRLQRLNWSRQLFRRLRLLSRQLRIVSNSTSRKGEIGGTETAVVAKIGVRPVKGTRASDLESVH